MENKKAKFTVSLDAELVTDVRNTVYEQQRVNPEYTLTQFIKEAVANEMARLKAQHEAGHTPPEIPRTLRRGRPLKKD